MPPSLRGIRAELETIWSVIKLSEKTEFWFKVKAGQGFKPEEYKLVFRGLGTLAQHRDWTKRPF